MVSNILHLNKVDVPSLVTYLNRPPMFEWYVIRCASKRKCRRKDVCVTWVGLRAQNMTSILNSIVNVIEGTYMTI